jgi:hypothetical protein
LILAFLSEVAMKRIGLALCPFGLGHDPAPARPAVERGIAAGELTSGGRLRPGLEGFDGDLLDEPRVGGKTEDEVD